MSDNPRPKLKLSNFQRPGPDTKFYVDYSWWEESNLDIKTYLLTRLDLGNEATLETEQDEVDIVDMETGEVRRVDGFQFVIQAYFSQLPEDFTARTSMVDAIFCVLLANANQPMTARDIAKRVKRPVDTVLRTIGGSRVYQGIRPIFDED